MMEKVDGEIEIEKIDIQRALRKLKDKKAAGGDGIPAKVGNMGGGEQ